jgi:hypothetical protein
MSESEKCWNWRGRGYIHESMDKKGVMEELLASLSYVRGVLCRVGGGKLPVFTSDPSATKVAGFASKFCCSNF